MMPSLRRYPCMGDLLFKQLIYKVFCSHVRGNWSLRPTSPNHRLAITIDTAQGVLTKAVSLLSSEWNSPALWCNRLFFAPGRRVASL